MDDKSSPKAPPFYSLKVEDDPRHMGAFTFSLCVVMDGVPVEVAVGTLDGPTCLDKLSTMVARANLHMSSPARGQAPPWLMEERLTRTREWLEAIRAGKVEAVDERDREWSAQLLALLLAVDAERVAHHQVLHPARTGYGAGSMGALQDNMEAHARTKEEVVAQARLLRDALTPPREEQPTPHLTFREGRMLPTSCEVDRCPLCLEAVDAQRRAMRRNGHGPS